TQPLNPELEAAGITQQTVLNDVMRGIVNPERIDQGRAPTCTVTSMQFELVRDDPSEYARIMAGLTGPSGTATMRGGGELKLEPDSLAAAGRDQRRLTD